MKGNTEAPWHCHKDTVPHAQGLGQQYCRLKETQGQEQPGSHSRVEHSAIFQRQKVQYWQREGEPGNTADSYFIVTSEHNGIFHSSLCTLDKKSEVTFSFMLSLPCSSSLVLSYLIAREGHHRCLTKVIDSHVFGREVCPNSERL